MLHWFPLCDVCILRDIVFFHVSSIFVKFAFPSKVKTELKCLVRGSFHELIVLFGNNICLLADVDYLFVLFDLIASLIKYFPVSYFNILPLHLPDCRAVTLRFHFLLFYFILDALFGFKELSSSDKLLSLSD